MLPTDETRSPQLDAILELFSQVQRRLYAYILAMVPSPADAEEVLQETNIVVWKKCDDFEPGSDFRAWVFRIALLEVRKFHERRRHERVGFSEELVEQLSSEYQAHEDELELRRERLNGCLDKLRPPDLDLVRRVYGQGTQVPQLAESTGREPTSIYRSLRRIRQLLLDCVDRTIQSEATP